MLELSNQTCVGLDEVGRGCLAKEVCTAAVIFPDNLLEIVNESEKHVLEMIKDSKKLSEKKRKICADFISSYALVYSYSSSSPEEIDEYNILNATMKCMHDTLDKIIEKGFKIDKILVDGNRFHKYKDIPHYCIDDGDNKYLNIASASILAKVYRDSLIYDFCKENPEVDKIYGFSKNKAYGTKQHLQAIKKFGPIKEHRKTFAPMKNSFSFT